MSKRRIIKAIIFFVCLSLLLITGCRKDEIPDYKKVEKTDYLMGTVTTIKVYTDDVQKGEMAINKAFDRIKEIEMLMSANIENSDVSRINNEAGGEWVKVHEDTFKVVQKGIYYGNVSRGLFDITVGPLVKMWGIGTDHPRLPEPEELEQVVELIDYRDVELEEENFQVRLKEHGMMIDLGGIAKGYAADEVKRIMVSEGIKHAVINLGGNVTTVGNKYNGESWKIGIQDPCAPTGSSMGAVSVRNKTIVTSGDYERYFERNGNRYHHILNPRTGYPANNNLKSVTIITECSFDADALSTTIFLMGPEKGMELIENLGEVEAIVITKDREIITSSKIKDALSILDQNFKIK